MYVFKWHWVLKVETLIVYTFEIVAKIILNMWVMSSAFRWDQVFVDQLLSMLEQIDINIIYDF